VNGGVVETLEPSHCRVIGKQEDDSMCSDAFVQKGLPFRFFLHFGLKKYFASLSCIDADENPSCSWNGKGKEYDLEKIAHYAELAWTMEFGKRWFGSGRMVLAEWLSKSAEGVIFLFCFLLFTRTVSIRYRFEDVR
jgi:hypothetical protein